MSSSREALTQEDYEMAAMKLKIREMQALIESVDKNADKNYLEFASTLSLFNTLEDSHYERMLIKELESLGQSDQDHDPLALIKQVNEQIYYKKVTAKLQNQLKELESENEKLEQMRNKLLK